MVLFPTYARSRSLSLSLFLFVYCTYLVLPTRVAPVNASSHTSSPASTTATQHARPYSICAIRKPLAQFTPTHPHRHSETHMPKHTKVDVIHFHTHRDTHSTCQYTHPPEQFYFTSAMLFLSLLHFAICTCCTCSFVRFIACLILHPVRFVSYSLFVYFVVSLTLSLSLRLSFSPSLLCTFIDVRNCSLDAFPRPASGSFYVSPANCKLYALCTQQFVALFAYSVYAAYAAKLLATVACARLAKIYVVAVAFRFNYNEQAYSNEAQSH